jgi:hypothetical protein
MLCEAEIVIYYEIRKKICKIQCEHNVEILMLGLVVCKVTFRLQMWKLTSPSFEIWK